MRLAKKPKLRMRTKPCGRMCSKKQLAIELSEFGFNVHFGCYHPLLDVSCE